MRALLERLPATINLQLQISNMMSRVQQALLDLGLLVMDAQQERTMEALLKSFQTELDGIGKDASSGDYHILSFMPHSND